ncbi:MAG: DUF3810 domain-containing protein [Saprospiraceae bacterium]
MKLLIRSTLGWVLGAALLVGLRYGLSAESLEQGYSRGLFLSIRKVLDVVFAWWPFPASAFVFTVALLFWIRSIYKWTRHIRTDSMATTVPQVYATVLGKVAAFGLALTKGAAMVVIAFLFLWGFNYGRVPLQDQLGITPRSLSTEELWEELRQTTKFVSILRTQLPLSNQSDYKSLPLDQNTQARIRATMTKQLDHIGYPTDGLVRIRTVWPGVLLRFNTSGIYFPLSGEGHVDKGLHTLQVPFVMAHEMAHGYGITNEGACNFLAWLACTRADNIYIRYSGHLMYYRYLGSAVRKRDPEGYAAFRQNLPVGVLDDLDSINLNLDKFDEIAPGLKDIVYDSYLKSQGIADGMASYSQVIDLVAAWQNVPPVPPEGPTAIDQGHQ